MDSSKIKAVVAGGLGTDLFGLNLARLVGKGELHFGGRLHVGAGGKSRNIAQMMAALLGKNQVAMIGRTSRDPMGLWRVPVKALRKAGVVCEFVKVIPFAETGKYPQIALIAVDQQGSNQIYVLPGINEDFCADDIDGAKSVFAAAAANSGILAISLEMPIETAVASVKQAAAHGLRTVVDPGGIRDDLDISALLAQPIFLFKPNEHEAKMVTGIKVEDADTARAAAQRILETTGVQNVMITLGARGAYLHGQNESALIPVPASVTPSDSRDETGCGDQTMAALCASLLQGHDLLTAAHDAIHAGTMQFYRAGIVPVTKAELRKSLRGC